jgi:hypothetical protein
MSPKHQSPDSDNNLQAQSEFRCHADSLLDRCTPATPNSLDLSKTRAAPRPLLESGVRLDTQGTRDHSHWVGVRYCSSTSAKERGKAKGNERHSIHASMKRELSYSTPNLIGVLVRSPSSAGLL